MKEYEELANAIIKSVTDTVGPVALMIANEVPGLTASPYKVTIEGDPVKAINMLIEKYVKVIGPSAVTLAKHGAEPILKKNKRLRLPKILKETR
ncbi:MAG: hypothetical protein ACE5J7_02920 [Candidatus Aenigmatarchaeota archaeon]